MHPRWRALLAVGTLLTSAMLSQQAAAAPVAATDDVGSSFPGAPAAAVKKQPNIVFILMDDFSLELLETMPEAQRLKAASATYENSFVIDSLCCPSRAALLTGQTPHQTGVLTNTPNNATDPIGGWAAFEHNGNIEKQFSLSLQDAGYTTGFVGKYLNGYEAGTAEDGTRTPPAKIGGWTEWNAILGGGYNGWGYRSTYLDENGEVQLKFHQKYPLTDPVEKRDSTYATNVASDLALDFIQRHRGDDKPYFLEVATYGPHSQLQAAYPNLNTNFPPAFADATTKGDPTGGNCGVKPCGDLTLADLAGYDDPRDDNAPTYLNADGSTSPAPAWRTNEISLTSSQALNRYRDRARIVQSIDRLIGRIRAAVGEDTYLVITADNGFHLGQHQLNGGKGTPYDSDTRVPLIVVGPGVVPGKRDQFVNNIDLAPTFEELAGADTGSFVSGRSFADTLSRPDAPGARYAFFEHTYAKSQPGEVDDDAGSGGTIDIIPSFIAVRSKEGLLARFDLDDDWTTTDYAYELYRYDVPWEDRNVFAEDHDKPYARDLLRRLQLWEGCEPAVCRAAAS